MIEFQPNIHYHKAFEAAIIGICLIEPNAFIRTNLQPEMFYFEQHRVVFKCLKEMTEEAIPIDIMTAIDYMERRKSIPHIQDHQTAWFLCKLTSDVIHSAHLKYWCSIVKQMWQSRELGRINPNNIQQAKATLNRIGNPKKSGLSRKTCRFLLTHISKEILKETLSVYGAKTIRGSSRHRVKVSSPLLVYLMSLVKPEYTWTCTENFDEQMSNEQCKIFIPYNSLLTKTGNGNIWIDKTNQYPAAWN